MPKAEMKKKMGKSPDASDALSLCFIDPDDIRDEDEIINVSY